MHTKPKKSVSDIDEFALIRQLSPTWQCRAEGWIGPGDDAAVFRVPQGHEVVWSTDACVENVHFRPSWGTWSQHGYRATCASLSDLAAMGAKPIGMLVSYAIPPRMPLVHLKAFNRGVRRAGAAYACPCLGGNLTKSAQGLQAHFSMAGSVPSGKALRRDTAKAGDEIWVTGVFGLSAAIQASDQAHEAGTRSFPRSYFQRTPRIREAIWLAGQSSVSAAIDISDGLLQDLAHLCRASHVGAELDLDSIPAHKRIKSLIQQKKRWRHMVLAGGEDYELCLCIKPGRGARMARQLKKRFGTRCTHIGNLTMESGIISAHGIKPSILHPGYRHFG